MTCDTRAVNAVFCALLTVLSLAGTLSACAPGIPGRTADAGEVSTRPGRVVRDTDLDAVLVRHLIPLTRANSLLGRATRVHCLGFADSIAVLDVGGVTMWGPPVGKLADPSPELLARFEDEAVPVQPVSGCEVDAPKQMEHERSLVRHRVTGARGVILWLASTPAARDSLGTTIRVGYYENVLSAAGWDCQVRYGAAGWAVITCELRWMS